MRNLKFWVNEWEHSWIMQGYWLKRSLSAKPESGKEAKYALLYWEYAERCHWAFVEIMRCLDQTK